MGGEVGTGGSATLSIDLKFLNESGSAIGVPWKTSRIFGPGTFSQSFTADSYFGMFATGVLPSGSKLRIMGSIELQAAGDQQPTTISIGRNEVGGGAPTAVFKTNAQGNWFDNNNWEPVPPNQPGRKLLANAVADRALFYADKGPKVLQSVTIDQPVMLGTLDVDGNTPHAFNASGNGSLTFATSQNNAVINMRPIAGASAINAPVALNTNLDIITEGKSSLLMSAPISGTGNINKLGAGKLILTGANTFTGITTAQAGTLWVSNQSGSAANNVTVRAGATFGGGGTVAGALGLFQDGHLSAGEGVGNLTVGGLTLTAGGIWDIESNATGMDSIAVTGTDALRILGSTWVNLYDRGGTKEGDYVIIDYNGAPLPDSTVLGNFQLTANGSPFAYSVINDRANTNIVMHVTKTGGPYWNVDHDASWGAIGSWSGAIPSITTSANFLDKITAPRTVTMGGNITVLWVTFDNANAYTLVPGPTGGTLNLGSDPYPGVINVKSGSHAILAPVNINNNSSITIVPGAALNLGGGLLIRPGESLDVMGGGTLSIGGPQTPSIGATLNVSSGRVNLNSNVNAAASANGANLLLNLMGNENNSPSSIVLGANQDLKALNVNFQDDGTQTFDFNSPPGANDFWRVNVYATNLNVARALLYKAIQNANAAGAVDPTDGIVDSALHANSRLGIAIIDNHVLIRPTRIGDATVDGTVNISDFNALVAHFDQKDTATWQEGDFDYDGSVTIQDFLLLAANFDVSYDGRGTAISPQDAKALNDFAAAHGVTVPEPALSALSIMTISAIGLRGRQRRA